jgi:hypothetical protein
VEDFDIFMYRRVDGRERERRGKVIFVKGGEWKEAPLGFH